MKSNVSSSDHSAVKTYMPQSADEKLSRDLAAFIQQEAPEEALAPHIKAIGKYLYANGGHSHMQDVRDRVQALGADVRLLDLYWKGIGEA